MSQSILEEPVSLHCLDFQAEDRLPPWWHVGQPCGKASWESLVGKPPGKATDPLIHAKGSATRDEDFIEHIYVANMHSTMLLFTQNGRCYWLKVYEIPEGSRASKGRAIQNVINIEPDDKIKTYLNVRNLKDEEYVNNNYLVLGTKKGIIKKTPVISLCHKKRVAQVETALYPWF